MNITIQLHFVLHFVFVFILLFILYSRIMNTYSCSLVLITSQYHNLYWLVVSNSTYTYMYIVLHWFVQMSIYFLFLLPDVHWSSWTWPPALLLSTSLATVWETSLVSNLYPKKSVEGCDLGCGFFKCMFLHFFRWLLPGVGHIIWQCWWVAA